MKQQPIVGRNLISVLIKAGLVNELTTRCVIDIEVDEFVKIYTQSIGDAALLEVVPALSDVATEIHFVTAEDKKDG